MGDFVDVGDYDIVVGESVGDCLAGESVGVGDCVTAPI
jgi:hypothetical protein